MWETVLATMLIGLGACLEVEAGSNSRTMITGAQRKILRTGDWQMEVPSAAGSKVCQAAAAMRQMPKP